MKDTFQDGNELEKTNDMYSQLVDAASEQVSHLFEKNQTLENQRLLVFFLSEIKNEFFPAMTMRKYIPRSEVNNLVIDVENKDV